MSKERVRALLEQLRQELETTAADPETVALARQLDADIHKMLESTPARSGGLVDRAKSMEVHFAVEHPVAERILREIVDALARMGV